MLTFTLKRLAIGLLCLVGVSLIIFVAMRVSGDPTLLLLPDDALPEDRHAMRVQLGLDLPVPVQFGVFLENAFLGDFGNSIRWKMPAMSLVLSRLPATLQLAALAFLIAAVFGLLSGVAAARLRGTVYDSLIRFVMTLGLALPVFWIGLMLIMTVSVNMGLLPTSGRGTFWHMLLPAVTMALNPAAALSRLTRSSMLNVLGTDYIKLARVKGNSDSRVVWKHGLRNASIPVVTLAGIQLANMIGNTVVVETIFAWPGTGKLIIDAILARDFPVVQAAICLIAAIYIGLNLLVDLLYGVLDPQIRY
ncbi:ABC-type transporter, integral membrane subunit [Rhizobium sp. CF080]|uniref:ABC transporter permease n=1 Tax=Rhizobium sp. (strain CF080) TaxID=1144310 RepID=UPI00027188B9|nr:ABC transporter permease [Rhizobium sp. CF080]EUB99295.1 ABC-type transporter, integral membrane subunit [Rhizobium sp. CF080]